MKRIAIFNHKGGVSKTTTTFNLGCALAKKDKTILLVDADAQCNLTLYAMGHDKYEQYCEEANKNNIYDCLLPAYKSQPKLIEAADCYYLNNIKGDIYLLPGNLNFTENEVQLGIAMQLSNALGSMRNLPGALNYLIEKTCEKYNIDYVLFDMNPSLSAINKDVLLTSDYFIVPTSPDYFSIMAIKSLSKILPSWEKWAVEARKEFTDTEYTLSSITPKFLGYTINDFNLSSGNPQRSFQSFMDRISEEIKKSLVPALGQVGMLLEEGKYSTAYENMRLKFKDNHADYRNEYCLAQISNFNKLIAMSNEKAVPIFDIWLRSAAEGQKKTLNWFRHLYNTLADRILELTQ